MLDYFVLSIPEEYFIFSNYRPLAHDKKKKRITQLLQKTNKQINKKRKTFENHESNGKKFKNQQLFHHLGITIKKILGCICYYSYLGPVHFPFLLPGTVFSQKFAQLTHSLHSGSARPSLDQGVPPCEGSLLSSLMYYSITLTLYPLTQLYVSSKQLTICGIT